MGCGAAGMRGLLIDDNTEITDMMGQFLTLHGYDCTISNNAEEGLQQILNKNYDFVLLDMAMPEISGIDVIESLEKRGELTKQKIIVLTASAITDEELADLLIRGVSKCLKKPIDLNRLLDVIKSCTGSIMMN